MANLMPGEIRKLPKANSPMFADQWAYQGTAKLPYVITHKHGSIVTAEGVKTNWACSCRNWTTTMPRQDCKHIIAVKLKENLLAEVTGKSGIPKGLEKEFQEFLKTKQSPAKKAGVSQSGLNLFQDRGRKFRV